MLWVALSRKLASTSLTKMGRAASLALPDPMGEVVFDPRGGAGLASGCFALDDQSEGPRPAHCTPMGHMARHPGGWPRLECLQRVRLLLPRGGARCHWMVIFQTKPVAPRVSRSALDPSVAGEGTVAEMPEMRTGLRRADAGYPIS